MLSCRCSINSIKSLQLLQNAAAHLLELKYMNISTVLGSLFKVELISNIQSPKQLSSKSLQEMSCPLPPTKTTSSSECRSPCNSKNIKKHNRRQSLCYQAPLLWNNPPASIREADTLPFFKSTITIFLFSAQS